MEDAGIVLKDAVCIVRKDKKVQMIFVNQTNKTYKILRGYIVGCVTALKQKEISEIQTTQDTKVEIDVLKRFEHSGAKPMIYLQRKTMMLERVILLR